MSWDDYATVLKIRGDRSRARVSYLEGELELLSPSYPHESIKTTFAILLEAWAVATKTPIIGAGSWTVRRKRSRRGVEPDECYIVGTRRKSAPDLAIEVLWTSGGLDELEIYRGLGVREVWVWEDGRINICVLGRQGYERRETSIVLPKLDLKLLARYAVEGPRAQTVLRFLAALKRSRRSKA